MLKSTIGKVCPSVNQTQEETWKPVVGHEGFYEISSIGRVRSLHRKVHHYRARSGFITKKSVMLKPYLRFDGYSSINLSLYGKQKTFKIHRLLGYAFLGLTDEFQVDHINGIRNDNRIENLRIVTCQQNLRSHAKAHGASKYRGVQQSGNKNKPWAAQIFFNRKNFRIGTFATEEEAALVYNAKAIEVGFNPEALNRIV